MALPLLLDRFDAVHRAGEWPLSFPRRGGVSTALFGHGLKTPRFRFIIPLRTGFIRSLPKGLLDACQDHVDHRFNLSSRLVGCEIGDPEKPRAPPVRHDLHRRVVVGEVE